MSDDKVLKPSTGNSVMHRMAERYGVTPTTLHKVVQDTVMPGKSSEAQFLAFLMVADSHKLNPMTKEIYAFPGKGGGVMPIVSVDGWSRIMNEHPQFNGIEFEHHHDGDRLMGITAVIYRKDRDHPTRVTEWMDECKGNTEPWKRWPARMLRHKAMIQCARIAFGFSGIYDPDEAARIESVRDIEAVQSDPGRGGVESLADAIGVDLEPEVVEEAPKQKKSPKKKPEPAEPEVVAEYHPEDLHEEVPDDTPEATKEWFGK